MITRRLNPFDADIKCGAYTKTGEYFFAFSNAVGGLRPVIPQFRSVVLLQGWSIPTAR